LGLDHQQPRSHRAAIEAKPPEPDPPTTAEAARLVEEAFEMDEDWVYSSGSR
jgi:hypothetical protein